MAHKVKVLAAKTDVLSLIPRIHTVEGENRLQEVASDAHTNAMVYMYVHVQAHTWNK